MHGRQLKKCKFNFVFRNHSSGCSISKPENARAGEAQLCPSTPIRAPCIQPRRPSSVWPWHGTEHLDLWPSAPLAHAWTATPGRPATIIGLWSSLRPPWGPPNGNATTRGHGAPRWYGWAYSHGLPTGKRPDDRTDPTHPYGSVWTTTTSNAGLRVWF